jgi:hypothetical protein
LKLLKTRLVCGNAAQFQKDTSEFERSGACQALCQVLRSSQFHKPIGLLESDMDFNFEQVHNYYERLVFEEVARRSQSFPQFTSDMLADVACVALNRLPARYVRHDVDLMFYLTEQERRAIELSMEEVLQFSFGFVQERAAKTAR